jgi:hypothetical protein
MLENLTEQVPFFLIAHFNIVPPDWDLKAMASFFAVFLLNVAAYLNISIKFFKVLCYSKMTFDWLPMINPYIWPFSIFTILTGPYFNFWARVLPSVKTDTSSMEISGIVALESLGAISYFSIRLINCLVIYLESTNF